MTSANNIGLPSRRTFLKLATIASVGFIYGNTAEPYDIEITTNSYIYPILRLNYKIIQISDLNIGS